MLFGMRSLISSISLCWGFCVSTLHETEEMQSGQLFIHSTIKLTKTSALLQMSHRFSLFLDI